MRKKQSIKTIGLASVGIAGAVALGGCDLDTDVEVYISDLVNVAETGESDSTPAEIGIEMGSMDQCQDDMGEVESIMQRHLPDFEARQCVQQNFQTYLQAEATIAMVAGFDLDRVEGLFSIGVEKATISPERTGYDAQFMVDRERFDQLSQEVERRYFQDVNFADSRLTVRVNNDERDVWTVHGQYIYFDETPVEQGSVELGRRDRTRIQLSDVARGALMSYGSTRLMVLESSND